MIVSTHPERPPRLYSTSFTVLNPSSTINKAQLETRPSPPSKLGSPAVGWFINHLNLKRDAFETPFSKWVLPPSVPPTWSSAHLRAGTRASLQAHGNSLFLFNAVGFPLPERSLSWLFLTSTSVSGHTRQASWLPATYPPWWTPRGLPHLQPQPERTVLPSESPGYFIPTLTSGTLAFPTLS